MWVDEDLRDSFVGGDAFTHWTRTSMFELQQKTRKKIQGLYLLSLFHHDILFLFAQLTRSTQLFTLFLSPGKYKQILVVNKPFGS